MAVKGGFDGVTYSFSLFLCGFLNSRSLSSGFGGNDGGLGGGLDLLRVQINFHKPSASTTYGGDNGFFNLGGLNLSDNGCFGGRLDGLNLLNGGDGGSDNFGSRHYCRARRELEGRLLWGAERMRRKKHTLKEN